jgi:hypothetical protein
MSGEKIKVAIDWENNAEKWWDCLSKNYPRLHAAFGLHNMPAFTRDEYDTLASLPGFSDGPAHAKHPIVVVNC